MWVAAGEWGLIHQAPTGGEQTGTVGILGAGCGEAGDQPGSVRKKEGSVEVILITYMCVGAVSGWQNRKGAAIGRKHASELGTPSVAYATASSRERLGVCRTVTW